MPPDQTAAIEGRIEKNGDFLIAPGRYYIEGLPAVIDKPLLYSTQRGYGACGYPTLEVLANTTTPYLFYLDVWSSTSPRSNTTRSAMSRSVAPTPAPEPRSIG